ncbi:MAG: hypothetical protein ABW007_27540 [Chitinophagaceae bacterium]
MPIANLIKTDERFELKSLPEAYVIIRRMTWGEKLKRQGMMTKFSMSFEKGQKDSKAEVDFMQEQVTKWEFSNLIIEHNLEYQEAAGTVRPYNFKNVQDIVALDPVVGEEIQARIDEINSFEEDEEVKN